MFEEIVRDSGFGSVDAELLGRADAILEPHYTRVVDRFYATIESNAEMVAVFSGPEQIARQKVSLHAWLELFFRGPYDDAYFEQRARIGRAHVRIGLDQRFMFSMMSVIRTECVRLVHIEGAKHGWSPKDVTDTSAAIDKLCDIELAVMLETYREDMDERLKRTERLAALGTFAATIGHELRNPLAVIDTSLHLLTRKPIEDPKLERHLGRIQQQVTICNEIITDLLELARDRPPEQHPVLVSTFLDEVMLPLRQEGVSIFVDVAQNIAWARFDAGQLRQVMANLVTNAIQAARGPANIEVRARGEGSALRLQVEDDGPGIAREHLSKLFEPLFTTRARGVGLGLALCRSVIEKHGGTIVASNGSKGALFSILLPGALAEPGGN